MKEPTRITVIGAGHGGKAMAANLALMGREITLYNRSFDHVRIIEERGGIDLESYEGGPHGFAKIKKVTSDMKVALEGAEMIMVVLPSSAHADVARLCAPHLKDGQIIVLHPGRTCGCIEFDNVLRKNGCTSHYILSETETFIYASRTDGPAQARIFRIKEAVPLAALPAIHNKTVLTAIRSVFPQFIDGVDTLHTGLNNMGAIFHPAITILNAGRIESTHGDFEYYIDGVTPSIARVLEVLDRERVTVAAALGIRARNAMEWLSLAYNVSGNDLHEAIHNQSGYYGIKAPATMNHRYIFEDVPMSLVPISELGTRYGVSTNAIDSNVRLGCIIHRTDYRRSGRTIDKLGIQGLSVSELTAYVKEGLRND